MVEIEPQAAAPLISPKGIVAATKWLLSHILYNIEKSLSKI
jgi:hypothetical protein